MLDGDVGAGSSTLLSALIVERAGSTPDLEMACTSDGQRITFREFEAEVRAVAGGLVSQYGIGRGTTVTWSLPTGIPALVLSAALHAAGARQNPIVPIYRAREFDFCVEQVGSSLLIVPGEWRGFDYSAMADAIATRRGVRVHDASTGLPRSDSESWPTDSVVPRDEPRWVFYTSGTTADPKGAIHRDDGLVAVADGLAERYDVEQGDRVAIVFPYTHVGGIVWLFISLRHGATLLLDPVFDPVRTTAFLSREDVTHAGAGTAFHLAYLAAQRERPQSPIFPRLKMCPSGGAPKPPHLHAEVRAALGGCGIVSGWGLTEAPILATANHSDDDNKLACTEGYAMPGVDLVAVRPDGSRAAPGEVGELRAKGPQVMVGYVDEALDVDAFDEQGYLRTGDLGYLDDDGYVVIAGRLKDVIIRNGENVSAKEVEDLLFAHPRIREVSVVGLPDARTGERVCAVIVRDGAPLALRDVTTFLRESGLRTQALPEQLELVDALPRNEGGKVLKNVLRDRLTAGPPTSFPGQPTT